MKRFRSKLSGGKKKEVDTPTTDARGMQTNPAGRSPSSSIVSVPGQVTERKKELGASVRKLFVADQPSNKVRPSEIVVSDDDPGKSDVGSGDMEPPPQTESLLLKRLNNDLPEDPNYQRKLDKLDISIEVLDHLKGLADVVGLVFPDALGLALERITAILRKLKTLVENQQAWKELLIAVDDRQRMFNEQLMGVQAQDLSPKLVSPIKQYAEALTKLAAVVMKQSGVAETGSPVDSLSIRIKNFISQYRNSDSDAENINDHKTQLAVVMSEFQVTITMYMAITLNHIEGMGNYLMASIFLEGGGSTRDRTSLRTNHRSCLAGTRVDVLQDISRWNQKNGDHSKTVYCIRDVAGAGKSTIAYTMAREWGIGECFVFFFSDYSRREARTLCNSLAKQILGSCHGPGWAEYWGSISSELSSPMADVQQLWGKLVSQPLGKCTVHPHHVLVIDALDECDKATRAPLLECILQTCSSPSSPHLRILLTTRREEDLSDILGQESYRDAILSRSLLGLESSFSDIGRYVEHRVDNSKFLQLTVTQRDKLVHQCGGLFIFASLACDLLENECPEDQPDELEKMLENFTSLDALYHQALSHAEGTSSRVRERVKDILRVILVAQEALSIATVAALISISTPSAYRLIKRLGSIIVSATEDQPVYFLHATLAEFLLRQNWIEQKKDPESGLEKKKRRENEYHITEAEGHRVVLKGCLSDVMAKELQFNICHLETSSLLNEKVENMEYRTNRWISHRLRYGCLQWANHLKPTMFDVEIFGYLQYFMNSQFLFWLEVLSVTKCVGLASNMLTQLDDWMKVNNQDNTMARDMQKFIATFASVISQSAPHIYLSALAFAPRNSLISKFYMKKHPQTLAIQAGGFSDWPHIQKVLFGHTSWVTSVAFSPDGKHIVSGSRDKTVRVWDAETGEVVAKSFEGHTDWVTSVAFSSDGKHIVSGSRDKTVRVWDAETGEVVAKPFEGHADWVNSVAFSVDGKHIVSGSQDHTIWVWDAETGEAVGKPFEGHTEMVTSVAFSPDGKHIVSGSRDKTVRVWDAETGEVVAKPFEGHNDGVNSVAFSADCKHIVSGSNDRTARVWDAETGEVVGKPLEGHTDWVTSVAFSADDKHIVSGSRDGMVRVLDAETGEVVGKPFEGHTNAAVSVAFSPDGKRIVSGSYDLTVRVWDVETGKVMENPFEGHTDMVTSVAFSSDGKHIVSGSRDKTVRVWDAETGEVVGKPFEGHNDRVNSVAFSADCKHIVSGSNDRTVRVWDAETGEVVGKPFEGHNGEVDSVAFSVDGKHIVSGSQDQTIRVWDAETGEAVGKPFEGHTNAAVSVAFSPDGKRIVSGSYDLTVRVWDAETGKVMENPFEGHTDMVTSVAFSSDGKHIVSGSRDRTVRVWDAETGEVVGKPFEGHNGGVNSVAFSVDGKHIVSGSWDETIRVWDTETGEAVGKPFEGQTYWVMAVAFSGDGKHIVSGSQDTAVRVWRVEKDALINSLLSSSRIVDGWAVDLNSEPLFWVPPQLRAGLLIGGATLIIGRFIKTILNLDSFVYGERWALCKEAIEI